MGVPHPGLVQSMAAGAFAAAEAWAPRLADEATRLGAGPAWAVAAGGARGGALVVHVDLSVLVWFVALAGLIWSLHGTARRGAADRLLHLQSFTGQPQPIQTEPPVE